jgi:hypothetical protein
MTQKKLENRISRQRIDVHLGMPNQRNSLLDRHGSQSKRLNATLCIGFKMRMLRMRAPQEAAMTGINFLARCAAGLALAGCTTAVSVGTDTIDPRYSVGGGQWSSGGGITIAARAFERNGVAVICGAWTMDRQSVVTSELNEEVMQAGSVYLGDDRAVQNLSFMRMVPYSDNIASEQANCVATGRPWKADYVAAPARVRIPRMAFLLDEETGDIVVFRETQRAKIIQ